MAGSENPIVDPLLEVSPFTLNHLIIIGKYFLSIYVCALNGNRYRFANFIALVQEKIELKKYIAILYNKLRSFGKKWSRLLASG